MDLRHEIRYLKSDQTGEDKKFYDGDFELIIDPYEDEVRTLTRSRETEYLITPDKRDGAVRTWILTQTADLETSAKRRASRSRKKTSTNIWLVPAEWPCGKSESSRSRYSRICDILSLRSEIYMTHAQKRGYQTHNLNRRLTYWAASGWGRVSVKNRKCNTFRDRPPNFSHARAAHSLLPA